MHRILSLPPLLLALSSLTLFSAAAPITVTDFGFGQVATAQSLGQAITAQPLGQLASLQPFDPSSFIPGQGQFGTLDPITGAFVPFPTTSGQPFNPFDPSGTFTPSQIDPITGLPFADPTAPPTPSVNPTPTHVVTAPAALPSNSLNPPLPFPNQPIAPITRLPTITPLPTGSSSIAQQTDRPAPTWSIVLLSLLAAILAIAITLIVWMCVKLRSVRGADLKSYGQMANQSNLYPDSIISPRQDLISTEAAEEPVAGLSLWRVEQAPATNIDPLTNLNPSNTDTDAYSYTESIVDNTPYPPPCATATLPTATTTAPLTKISTQLLAEESLPFPERHVSFEEHRLSTINESGEVDGVSPIFGREYAKDDNEIDVDSMLSEEVGDSLGLVHGDCIEIVANHLRMNTNSLR